jgi:hypothetical protein
MRDLTGIVWTSPRSAPRALPPAVMPVTAGDLSRALHLRHGVRPTRHGPQLALAQALLGLTLTSIRAQTDPDFRVVILGHDRPATLPDDDPRVEFLEADWPAEAPGPHNADSGRKKHAINDLVLERGGGLLMFVDADDWVDRDLVSSARGAIRPRRHRRPDPRRPRPPTSEPARRPHSRTRASSPGSSTACAAPAPSPVCAPPTPTRSAATRSASCAPTTSGSTWPPITAARWPACRCPATT